MTTTEITQQITRPIRVSSTAVLDDAHVGDIRGALGTIRQGDIGERRGLGAKFKTLIAIVGPGLIVMVGDNDAGAFSTYASAGQNYGTHLLWTLLLLVPEVYVNQEMVLRLGAVARVGHARLILQRFGRFWGAFSVIDLFLLNALTIVTEFIGITIGLAYLGLPRLWGVLLAAACVIGAASTGSFRRFERVCVFLCLASLLLVPILLMVHPSVGQMAHDFVVPGMPSGNLASVMLLIIAIVGTTVAPWQLFFQQSYVIDKRITPRFIRYERVDLWIGIVIVVVGAVAMMSFSAQAFAGTAGFGNFTDTAGVAAGLAHYAGHVAGVLFAIALIDASIIGASAVSLSTAYAIGDLFAINHSLHRKPSQAKGFYAVFVGLVGLSAALVLIPDVPLGLVTNAVQALAGVLLPSASVFLLLLCNDKDVLGPWVNSRKVNVFTSAVIGVLVMLSIILTASVLFPSITDGQIIAIMVGFAVLGVLAGGGAAVWTRTHRRAVPIGVPVGEPVEYGDKWSWRMPPLAELGRPQLSAGRRLWLGVLRGYLVLAVAMVVIRVVQLAVGH